MISQQLLDILVCPVSQGKLTYDESTQELVCQESGLAYPIRDGIPVMLQTEARKLIPST
jgi:uncharacterized protein YbaR (Trm112 family)